MGPVVTRYVRQRKQSHVIPSGAEMKQRAGAMVMPVAAVGLLLLVGSVPARAQDPAVVNAETLHVKLENSRVRVLEAVLPPGAKEKLHSHPAYVIHVVAGGKMRNHAVDGSTSEIEFKTGDTIYRDPLTHWAENIGNTTIRLVLVELKGSAP
jgi:quercetin dioxygenase-like cupin family protein